MDASFYFLNVHVDPNCFFSQFDTLKCVAWSPSKPSFLSFFHHLLNLRNESKESWMHIQIVIFLKRLPDV
jgi:hypothetical protein